ncbi:hypothetical protein FB45DRAFT_1122435 [Roridomyces roridus]|uniref:NAD(P)-binding protein n=1 Tax=Roridomyces roridus TaxID=1738132 RepID=A0AAD7FB15_9AGAR|nr:hypothetical protein FB45DRAFT_1122435 [Roridomyces roridus]
MSSNTVYLVTGANRGMGLGLLTILAARPNTIVFAGARNPDAQSLKDLAAERSNVHPIKFIVNDKANNEAVVAEIEKIAGQLDVIIANAGVAQFYGPVATTPLDEYKAHWEINTLGTIVLYQAAQELLLASPTGIPVFAYVSTGAASMARFLPMKNSAYASSKAAANFIVKALDAENPSLIALAISPGWVATDTGNPAAVANGLPEAPMRVEDVVPGILSRIDGATKEKSSGRFWNFKPTFGGMPWDINTEEVPW